MIPRAQACINISALKHNFQFIRQIAHQQKILAMIKANAYGHGSLPIARALMDADGFGVASIDEALLLRKEGITQSITVMSGFSDQEELLQFSANNINSVIHHISQVEILEKNRLDRPLFVWIKIDTGMHRLGLMPEEVATVYQRLMALSWVKKPIGIMTHLAKADAPDRSFTEQQLNLFSTCTQNLVGTKSIANSAAILAYPESYADWVRPGIMLYGVSPFSEKQGNELGLQPVMSLTAKIMAIKSLRRGDLIGYGGTWQCPENMPVGVVAIGYGDGYPRHAKNGTPVSVNNVICPLVGRVSMDMITIDLRGTSNVKVGDNVVLWGKELPIEKIAMSSDTIAYELLCNIAKRVDFVYI